MRQELVGRDAELAVLTECLAASVEGHPQLVLCRGEPGIGKTRLSTELAARAAARGALCLWGQATDAAGAPPSWPWRQVLFSLAGEVDIVSVARERRLTADLSRLAPDLFADAEPDVDDRATPEDRFRQFEAVSRLLREACRPRPLVIVLDDLHWADASTLLPLRHLVRSLAGDRLLVVANTRPGHDELLGRLAREPLTTVLDLGGLGDGAVRAQLAGLLGKDVDDDTAGHVRSLTGGNPFFVHEVGRAMADARAGRRFSLVTPTARDAIGERLAELPEVCVRLLGVAALVGPEFSVPLVAAASDSELMNALDLMGVAAGAGLVEPTSGPQDLRFVHALVREAIESGLAPAEAVRLHRRIATALERVHGHALGARVFDVARHWFLGAMDGDRALAAGWLARAGDEAMRRLGYEEAAALFGQAVEVGGAEVPDEERWRLLVSAGRARQLAADLSGRLEVCLEACAVARRLDRPDLFAEATLVLEAGDARFDVPIRRLCEEALARLGSEGPALRARLMARFVETFMFQRHDDAVMTASKEALVLAEESGDPNALAAAA